MAAAAKPSPSSPPQISWDGLGAPGGALVAGAPVLCWDLTWRHNCTLQLVGHGVDLRSPAVDDGHNGGGDRDRRSGSGGSAVQVQMANGQLKAWPGTQRVLPTLAGPEWFDVLEHLLGPAPTGLAARIEAVCHEAVAAMRIPGGYSDKDAKKLLKQLRQLAAPLDSAWSAWVSGLVRLRDGLDCRDLEGKWLPAQIVSISTPGRNFAHPGKDVGCDHPPVQQSEASAAAAAAVLSDAASASRWNMLCPVARLRELGLLPPVSIRVNFVDWDPAFDETLPLGDGLCRLAPLGSLSSAHVAKRRLAHHGDLVAAALQGRGNWGMSPAQVGLEVLLWSPDLQGSLTRTRDWVEARALRVEGGQIRVEISSDPGVPLPHQHKPQPLAHQQRKPKRIRLWHHLELGELRLSPATMQALRLPGEIPLLQPAAVANQNRHPPHKQPRHHQRQQEQQTPPRRNQQSQRVLSTASPQQQHVNHVGDGPNWAAATAAMSHSHHHQQERQHHNDQRQNQHQQSQFFSTDGLARETPPPPAAVSRAPASAVFIPPPIAAEPAFPQHRSSRQALSSSPSSSSSSSSSSSLSSLAAITSDPQSQSPSSPVPPLPQPRSLVVAQDSGGLWQPAEVLPPLPGFAKGSCVRLLFLGGGGAAAEEVLDAAAARQRCRPPDFLNPATDAQLARRLRDLRVHDLVWVCNPLSRCSGISGGGGGHVYPLVAAPTRWVPPGSGDHSWVPGAVLRVAAEQLLVCVSSRPHGDGSSSISPAPEADPDAQVEALVHQFRAAGGDPSPEHGFFNRWFAPRFGEVAFFAELTPELRRAHAERRELRWWRETLGAAIRSRQQQLEQHSSQPHNEPHHQPRTPLASSVGISFLSGIPVSGCPSCSGLNGRPPVGLRNLGNTCYLGAAVQCLASIPALLEYFLGHAQYLADLQRNLVFAESSPPPEEASVPRVYPGTVTLELADLLGQLMFPRISFGGGNGGAQRQLAPLGVSPEGLKQELERRCPRFSGAEEQDSQEFLHTLLDQLNDELRLPQPPSQTPQPQKPLLPSPDDPLGVWRAFRRSYQGSVIADFFFGLLESVTACEGCGRCSRVYEVFSHLSLEIPQAKGLWRLLSTPATTLDRCLQQFAVPERLHGDNAYSCSTCQRKQPANKTLTVFKPPPALFIHLKRVRPGGARISTEVSFTAELQLDACLAAGSAERGIRYGLQAAVYHLQDGELKHFVAAAKTRWCPRHRLSLHGKAGAASAPKAGGGTWQRPSQVLIEKAGDREKAAEAEVGGCGCQWTLFDDSRTRPTNLAELQANPPGEVYLLLYLRVTVEP